jgi:hypothetical protein
MAKDLSFTVELIYPESADGITLPVSLHVGESLVVTDAKVDTGASHCLFRYEHAEKLGIRVEEGIPLVVDTLSGSMETFGHEITLQTYDFVFHSMVYFAKYPGLRRNLLGRNGWLRNLRLGVVDYDNLLYLSRYGE